VKDFFVAKPIAARFRRRSGCIEKDQFLGEQTGSTFGWQKHLFYFFPQTLCPETDCYSFLWDVFRVDGARAIRCRKTNRGKPGFFLRNTFGVTRHL